MPLDKEKARINIKEILDRMEKNTDAALLHEYYKLFKKEVPLFKRSFAAAWLFMNYDEKAPPRFLSNDKISVSNKDVNKKAPPQIKEKPKEAAKKAAADKQSGKNTPVSDSESPEKKIIFIPEEEAKYLFFSIGKNRRLFPREIITFILSRTSCEREDIGSIRILDNYSFVQVRDKKADEIIEKLTEQKFRGRTLTVNYAKARVNESGAE